jgi:hypothetical protein
MKGSGLTRSISRVFQKALALPVRRPRATLGLTLAVAALAVVSISRIRPDASIESMFSRNDPAAAALVRVLNHFGAAEELLVLASVPPGGAGKNGAGKNGAGEDGASEDSAREDSAREDAAASAERLLAFAGRFERMLDESPEAAAMADGVAYRADPQFRQFVERVLVPHGLFYLDDASFAAARRRLTTPEMRAQIEQNAAALAQPGPAASAMAKVLLQDPLRLHEFLTDRLAAGRGTFKTFRGGEDFVSPDGRAILIRVAGKRPPSDLDFSRGFTAAVRSVGERANTDGLTLAYSGSYAIAATSERAIRGDMVANIVSAVACIVVLFLVASRRPLRTFSLAFGPVALGTLLGFGAYALFAPTLTPLTGAVGAILAGMGIDYSIHYLSHYQGRRRGGATPAAAAEQTAAAIGPALFAAWLTSVIGFVAVGGSRVSALRDFAVLGGLGLAGSFVAAVVVLPALLVLLDRRDAGTPGARRLTGPRLGLEPLARWLGRRGGRALAASGLLLAVAIGVIASAGGNVLPLESDLTVMHPRPNPALDTQAEVARRFGASPESMIVHLKADSPVELVALAHRVTERLSRPGPRGAGITATLGLATLLPDPTAVPARLAAIGPGEAERVVGEFKAVVADSPFNAGAYEPYAGFLRVLLSQRTAPGLEALTQYPRLARTVLPTGGTGNGATRDAPGAAAPHEAITLVFLGGGAGNAAARDAAVLAARGALAGLPGATLTGMTVLGHDTEAEVRRELPRLFCFASALVVGYLLLHFRSARDAALAVLPTAFSFVLLLAVMRLAGQKLNMMNLVALPLLIGIDVDYGIFLVSLARSARAGGADAGAARERIVSELGTGCYAIAMCAATTVLGFGSLVTTSVPAVRSLGLVVGVGVIGCLYATLFVLAPLLLMSAGRSDRRGAPAGAGMAATPAGGPAPGPARAGAA